MPPIVLKSIGSPSYSDGAKSTGSGVGLPLVTPLFPNWASGQFLPPAGIGTSFDCGITYIAVDDSNGLYMAVAEAGGNGRGVQKYTLNVNDDPMTITSEGFVSLGTLGLSGYTGFNCFDFDRTDGSMLLTCYNTTSLSVSAGRWLSSNWPWTSANAMWTGVPTSYGSVQSGKVSFLVECFAIDRTNDLLVMGSWNSSKADVFRYSDGVWLGAKQWNSTYTFNYKPIILGFNHEGYLLCGGYLSSLHSGRVHAYSLANPNSWSDQGQEYDRPSSAYNLQKAIAYKRPLPIWGYGAVGRIKNIGQGQHEDCGWNGDSWSIMAHDPVYDGKSKGHPRILWHDTDVNDYREYNLARHSSFGRSGFSGSGPITLWNFSKVNGQPWFFYATQGTPDHLADVPAGARSANGIAAMFCGVGKVTYSFTVSVPQTPRVLSHPVVNGARNAEHSDHPNKHRFRLSVDNGNSWTGWRSGSGLAYLQETHDGDPAWPDLPVGQTIIVEHEMSSGVLNNWARVHGRHDADTDWMSSSDMGPPREVNPILVTDYAELGGGLL